MSEVISSSWKTFLWKFARFYPVLKTIPSEDYHPLIRLSYALENAMEEFRNGELTYTKSEMSRDICTEVSFEPDDFNVSDKMFENICLIKVIQNTISYFRRLKCFHWGKFFRLLTRSGFTKPEEVISDYFVSVWKFDLEKVECNFMRSGSMEPSAKPNKSSTPGAGKERGVKRKNKYDSLYSRWATEEWLGYMRTSKEETPGVPCVMAAEEATVEIEVRETSELSESSELSDDSSEQKEEVPESWEDL